jgi:hypothetical protein
LTQILNAIRKLDDIRRNFPYQTDGAGIQSGSHSRSASARVHREIAAVGDRLQIRGRACRDPLCKTSSFKSGRTGILTPVAVL